MNPKGGSSVRPEGAMSNQKVERGAFIPNVVLPSGSS